MYGIKTPTSYMSPELSLHKWKFQVYLCGEKKPHKNKKTFLDGILFYFTLTSVFYFVIFYGYNWKRQTIVRKVCFKLTLTFNQVYA